MRYFFWSVFVFIILAVLFNLFISFGIVNSASSIVAPISNFVTNNKSLFLVWHLLMYFAIFQGLHTYANHMINNNKLPDNKKKDALIFCYIATFIVIVFDIILYTSGGF